MSLLVSVPIMIPYLSVVSHLLIPAIITHKGAAADAGHYMGFVKKSVILSYKTQAKSKPTPSPTDPSSSVAGAANDPTTVKELDDAEGDDDWYKFDDEKVSIFPKEKLATLDGGGEDSSAYVLLYRSKNV
jgi:ubiquitin carboxyl-terminal hydrolase 14